MSLNLSSGDRTAVADRDSMGSARQPDGGSHRVPSTTDVEPPMRSSGNKRVLLAAAAGLIVVLIVSYVFLRPERAKTAPAGQARFFSLFAARIFSHDNVCAPYTVG